MYYLQIYYNSLPRVVFSFKLLNTRMYFILSKITSKGDAKCSFPISGSAGRVHVCEPVVFMHLVKQ